MTEHYYKENTESLKEIYSDNNLTQSYNYGRQAQRDEERLKNIFFTSLAPTIGNNKFQKFLQDEQNKDFDFLNQKYGSQNLSVLHKNITDNINNVSNELSSSGYNFDRISDFENRMEGIMQRYQQQEANERLADEHSFGSSISTFPIAMLQGVDYVNKAVQTVQQRKRGQDDWRPITSTDMELTNYISDIRGKVGENLEEKYDWYIEDQNIARFLYDTGMSIGDSGLSILFANSIGASALLASQSASRTAKGALDNGATSRQATLSGLAAGIVELVAEKMSIGQLLKPKAVRNMHDLINAVLKQSGIGFVDEFLTEAVNIISNAVITKNDKEFHKSLKKAFETGATVSEAYKEAIFDAIKRTAKHSMWAGVGGAISGNLKGAIDGTSEYKSHTTQVQKIYGVSADALINESIALDPKNKYARYLKKLSNEGREISGEALNALIYYNEKIMQQQR